MNVTPPHFIMFHYLIRLIFSDNILPPTNQLVVWQLPVAVSFETWRLFDVGERIDPINLFQHKKDWLDLD